MKRFLKTFVLVSLAVLLMMFVVSCNKQQNQDPNEQTTTVPTEQTTPVDTSTDTDPSTDPVTDPTTDPITDPDDTNPIDPNQPEPHEHSYVAAVTAPTCEAAGYTTYTCACGDTYTADETDALGHTPGAEATCTTAQICTVCQAELVAALGHDYDAVVTDPTCTAKGFTTYTCACGDTYTADETDALGHTPGAEATCTTAQICTVCQAELVAALGHDYDAVVTDPTCTAKGFTTYTCACGDTYTADETDALGHDYDAVVTDPTCTEAGYTTYTCACGDTYIDDETDALGHDYDAVVTDPTCTEAGYTTHTCSVCGDTYTDGETDALGHDYDAVVTDPTCTEAGYTTHTCSVCSDTYTDSETDALGHTPGAEATCTTAQICTVCEAELVAALGHAWVDANCTTPKTCSACGTTEGEALGHSWVDATCQAPKTCSACGITEGEALDHSWVDATCQAPTTCSACGATEGEALEHQINKEGICDACGESFVRTINFLSGNVDTGTQIAIPVSGIVGEEITLPTPRKSNYNFGGWYLDNACTTPFEETTFSEDLTLYAKWISNTSEQISVLSYFANNSNMTWHYNGPIRQAIEAANSPDVICLQAVGSNWQNAAISGYTASPQNKNTLKFLIHYKTDKFTAKASDYNDYFSYIILQRKSDGALFTVINGLFGSVTEETKLEAIRETINGIWNDANHGLMPMIIAGSFSSATTTDSIAYKSLVENSVFVDTSKSTKAILSTNSADNGNYIFASHHMQYTVEGYNVLDKKNTSFPILVNVALSKVCAHVLTKTEAIDATCTTAGNKEYYTCSSCGKVYADAYGITETTAENCYIPALGYEHTWVDATCEAPKTCSVCNVIEGEALGHSWEEATCEAPKTCPACGKTEGEALGHAWTNDCDTECNNNCGTTREITHNYVWIVDNEPTVTTEGVKHEECTVCHNTRNENTTIEKLTCTHSLTKTEATDATCTTMGNKEYYTCSVCHKVYSNAEGTLETTVEDCVIPALGHSYESVVTDPTCTEAGFTTYTCACGDTYTDNETDALGHSWTDATCTAPQICSTCGVTQGEPNGHQINEAGICTACGESFVRTINFLSGNVDGGTQIAAPVSGIVGEEIPLPTPKKSNYNFAGWYLDNTCKTPFEGTTFSENLTLYAKWISNTSEQISVLSYFANNSNMTWQYNGPIRQAIEAANSPDVICLQAVGSNWSNAAISGYTASPQNKNTQKFLIHYKTDKFTAKASNYNDYFSYIVLQRKSDGALFTVINGLFTGSVNEETKLEEMWERIDGIWKDAGRGCMPIIIAGSFGSATTTDSVAYKSLTENSLFVDASKDAKAIPSANTADTGNYIFASHHMQYAVESYNVLDKKNTSFPLLVKVALPNVCAHVLTKTEAVDATCEAAGSTEYYTCSKCGKVYADVYGTIETTPEECRIPALGHSWVDATDTDPKTCSVCGKTED